MFTSIDVNPFPLKDLIEVIEIEAIDKALKESITLQKLAFDVLGMASGGQSLSVSIFLLTDGACSGASCASWMF